MVSMILPDRAFEIVGQLDHLPCAAAPRSGPVYLGFWLFVIASFVRTDLCQHLGRLPASPHPSFASKAGQHHTGNCRRRVPLPVALVSATTGRNGGRLKMQVAISNSAATNADHHPVSGRGHSVPSEGGPVGTRLGNLTILLASA
jgi:hypothetical protein